MTRTRDLEVLKSDIQRVEAELEGVSDDPWGTTRAMWEGRLTALRSEIDEVSDGSSPTASVSIVFDGGPVRDATEIDALFASKALDAFQSIVNVQFASANDTEVGDRGRLRGTAEARLFIRDVVHGSFGFVLEEGDHAQGEVVPTTLRDAVEHTTETLSKLSSDDEDDVVSTIARSSARYLQSVQKFAKVLNDFDATVSVYSETSKATVSNGQRDKLISRLHAKTVESNSISRTGVLVGLLLNAGRFEISSDGDDNFLSGDIDSEYLERLRAGEVGGATYLRRRVRASLTERRTMKYGKVSKVEYTLDSISLIRSEPNA